MDKCFPYWDWESRLVFEGWLFYYLTRMDWCALRHDISLRTPSILVTTWAYTCQNWLLAVIDDCVLPIPSDLSSIPRIYN